VKDVVKDMVHVNLVNAVVNKVGVIAQLNTVVKHKDVNMNLVNVGN
jgi:hypothetical protein